MDREQELREIREAIDAGRRTLQYLYQAREQLNSASGFGIADMLGFDLIGGIGKHMKFRDAQNTLEMAKRQVMVFQKELRDVSRVLDFQIDIGGFLTFADFFFDGILADIFVQSKISEAKEQVDRATWQIEQIVNDLFRMEREMCGI
ncbi:MAG: hypothetical protein HFE73_00360 [Firmicutes bacterium]|nr:hypothetical protein [Bacillota bacterium]